MILGIGAGDRPLMALGMRPARLASLRASIEAIRALWSGGDVTVEDRAFVLEHAHMRFAARPDIPIYVAASGPKTLELAGEIADGVILLVGLFPEALAWALDHVDRDAAMESARTIAAWFPQTSPAICELWGLSADLVEDVRRRYAGGEFQEAMDAARLLPDGFVRSVALAGDSADARDRITTVCETGADSIHVFPLGANRMQTIEAFAGCLADVTGVGAR